MSNMDFYIWHWRGPNLQCAVPGETPKSCTLANIFLPSGSADPFPTSSQPSPFWLARWDHTPPHSLANLAPFLILPQSNPHTLQRTNSKNSKQIFPEKELHVHSPNFHIHVSVSDLYIPTINLPILLQEICGPILGKYKSLTDTWMWKLGLMPHNSQKRNTKMGFSLQCRPL